MKRSKKITLFFLAAAAALLPVSCEVTGWCDTRRPIYDEVGVRVMVRVNIDWSQAGLEPETPDGRIMASVWFFPIEGGDPFVLATDDTRDSIPLPPGNYHILAFNGVLEPSGTHNEFVSSSFNYIGFRATERYETFEAYCRKPLVLSAERFLRAGEDDTPPSVASPEVLATDHYRNTDTGDVFGITIEMVDNDRRPELYFSPRRCTSLLHVRARVMNLISLSAMDGANVISVSGLAESMRLASGEPGTTSVTHFFPIGDRAYNEGSQTDGTVNGYCYTFGLTSAAQSVQRVSLYFTMRDGGTPLPFDWDVTNRFLRTQEPFEEKLYVEVGDIHLPDTQPSEGAGSLFDAQVENWGANVDILIEI
jgi:hypothetical protein